MTHFYCTTKIVLADFPDVNDWSILAWMQPLCWGGKNRWHNEESVQDDQEVWQIIQVGIMFCLGMCFEEITWRLNYWLQTGTNWSWWSDEQRAGATRKVGSSRERERERITEYFKYILWVLRCSKIALPTRYAGHPAQEKEPYCLQQTTKPFAPAKITKGVVWPSATLTPGKKYIMPAEAANRTHILQRSPAPL